ncbi:hypothetical protein CWB41_10340 [Methylovirgula ligni]|nr:hypothetical protein [Methylovirgula ligni]QAY96079.1 hypothetical protein CWB41_10340 [Methylovirgula ligni]
MSVAQILLQVAASIFGGWLAAIFSLRIFRSQRVWERKAEAYTAIFDALYDMARWYDEHFDAEISGRELSEDKKSELSKAYMAAKEKLKRRIASETWLLPEVASQRLEDLFKRLSIERNDWFKMLDEDSYSISMATLDLRLMVREDLGLEGSRLAVLTKQLSSRFTELSSRLARSEKQKS